MNKKILFLAALLAGLTLSAQEFSPKKAEFTLPVLKKAPVMDGKISAGEYFGGSENFGMMKHMTKYLASRQGSFSIAFDAENIYLACRSELPDVNLPLKNRVKKRDGKVYDDDNVEFLISPPDNTAVYHLIVNPAGKTYDVFYPVVNGGTSATNFKQWNPAVEIKSLQENKFWTVEIKIPLKEFQSSKTTGPLGTWSIQAARSWTNPREQCPLNQVVVFADLDGMTKYHVVPESASVRFIGLGEEYKKGKNRITFEIDNPTAQPKKIAYRIQVTSEAAPRQADNEVTVAPGKTERVTLHYDETSKITNDMNVIFQDADSKQTLFQRSFAWTTMPESRWILPDVKRSADLEIGVYPYFNKLKVRYGNAADPLNMKQWKSATVRILDSAKKVVKTFPAHPADNGFAGESDLKGLDKGAYTIECHLEPDGKGETLKKTAVFQLDKFPWERNGIGKDRVILPPYQPLQYGKDTIRTLLAEYQFGNGFFQRITVDNMPNILSAPITWNINGEQPVPQNFRFAEQSPDRGVTVNGMKLQNLDIHILNLVEYDNFVKTTIRIAPQKPFPADSVTIDIPLKAEIAELFHTTCNTMKYNPATKVPQGSGSVWDSRKAKTHPLIYGNFRPYLWVGGLEKGLAFFTESDKNWSLDPEKPMMELIRKDGTVLIRIHIVNKKTVWDKPFEITVGFQATPTRKRPENWRKMAERVKFSNAVTMSTLAGGGCWSSHDYDPFPKNKDYNYIKAITAAKNKPADATAQKAFVDEYMKKNFSEYQKDRKDFFERHLLRGFAYANISTLLIPYLNSRATQLRWPEYQVYMDEWFCSPWRANNEDDYNTTPTLSYQDMMLYYTRELVRAGLDGIYYDNIRDWTNPNPVTGPAYELPSGKIQPYFDIFSMRELIKRTAVMLYQEGKTFLDGRPLFVLHMTNTNIVPFMSLGSITLDMEDKYGSMDFQDRFTEDYIKTTTIGTQCGNVPEILVQITGKNRDFVTRTFLAVTLAYDLPFVMNGGGLTGTWINIWKKLHEFGYATKEVKVYPAYEKTPFGIQADSDKVRFTVYDKPKTGERVIAVSSFGHDGELTLTLNAKEAADFETGAPLSVKDGRLKLNLSKHDFKLIRIKL